MAAYLVKEKIRMLGTGLERLPGQHVTDADFRTCPSWRNTLLASGAIVEHSPEAPTAQPVTTAAFGAPLMPVMVEQYDIPETPAEERRKKRGV